MKIKMNGKELTVQVHVTSTTPAAGNYWTISYLLDGISLASVHTGPSFSPPEPLDLLNAERKHTIYDYTTPDADEHQGINWDGQKIAWKKTDPRGRHGECGNRRNASIETTYTIREKIEWALSQVVIE